MKRMLLSAIAGVMVIGAATGATTACDKIENPRETIELVALIIECEALNEADYTHESWIVFQEALSVAEQVSLTIHPPLEKINTAIKNLRDAREALVPKES